MYFMSTKQIQKRKEIVIHDFDKGLDHTIKAIEKLSIRNSELIKKYNKEMVRNSLAKGNQTKTIIPF